MTDENTTEELEAQTPESKTFTITATRQYEVDFTDEEILNIIANSGKEDVTDALEEITANREQRAVEPTEKLLGVDVNVDGPSDD
jgi:hypothetical protein